MTIQLNDSLFIGEGASRRCFQHPDDSHRCIKIDNPRNGVKPTYRESLYYKKLARRSSGGRYDFISGFHGFIETNLGEGGVFDLCRNEDDGEIATTLSEFLTREMNEVERGRIEAAVNEFCEKLLKHWLVSSDLRSHNICVAKLKNGGLKLVCVDGLGSKEFLPFCDIWPWWARRKMKRHFKKYHLDNIDDLIQFGAGLKPAIKR